MNCLVCIVALYINTMCLMHVDICSAFVLIAYFSDLCGDTMYLMYVATVLVLSVYVVMYFVYGYRVSPLLHCISVLYKCYVHYITALLSGFFWFFWKG